MRLRLTALIAILLGAAASAFAAPDISVGDMDNPQHKWGPQVLSLPITNNADYYKFVVVKVTLQFEGEYLNPARGARANYILEPQKTIMVGVPVDVPPNYGVAHVNFEVYDVVDTVDALLPSQKVLNQAAQMRFNIPPGMVPYMQDRLTMTPMVDHNPYLGTEFTRAMIVMMKQGKTLAEIAKLAELDTTYLKQLQDTLLSWQFFGRSNKDSSVVPAFPVLSAKEAESIRPLVDKTSTDLAELIAKNLPAYKRVLDSLVKAGTLSADSNDFINGGTVLYRVYPVVTALLLWYDLGQGIVGGTTALDVYRDTDPCNADITRYLYAIQGGDVVNGNQYYNYSTETGRSVILFGDRIPVINCPQSFPWKRRLFLASDYDYDLPDKPEMFTFDTVMVNPALRALGAGAPTVLQPAVTSFKSTLTKMGNDDFTQGTVLWFWNQVATKTTAKMIAKGAMTRRNNGQYRFESMNGVNYK